MSLLWYTFHFKGCISSPFKQDALYQRKFRKYLSSSHSTRTTDNTSRCPDPIPISTSQRCRRKPPIEVSKVFPVSQTIVLLWRHELIIFNSVNTLFQNNALAVKFKLNDLFLFPLSHSQSDPVVWSQLRFPQGFLKGKQTALNCSCAFFNCRWSCQTICSISHGKQYKLIYGLPGWHNSPRRLKAFLYLSTLWPSFWAAEAKDNCAHLSQSCWSERKESCRTHTFDTLCSPPISSILLYN